jgi:hypothetical protein
MHLEEVEVVTSIEQIVCLLECCLHSCDQNRINVGA